MRSRSLAARAATLVLSAVLFASAAPTFAQPNVLVPGSPPLTESMAENYAGFFEWLLDAPLTAGQRQEIRDSLLASWRASDRGEIDGTVSVLDLWSQIAQRTDAERDILRAQLQPEVLGELRKHPNDPGAMWVLGVYDAAHQPLAEGTPPLTRQIADAYLEVQLFILGVVMDGQPPSLDAKDPTVVQLKKAWADSLAADYAGFSAEQQAELAKMPLASAALRALWPALPEEERTALRDQWSQTIAPPEASSEEASTQEPQTGSQSALADAMQKMQQNQATYQWVNNMSWQMHATNYNVIQTLSGVSDSYRYVWR